MVQHFLEDPDTPVIVVGSGLAGLSAAYSALQSGARRVCLLDRALKPGGNSIKASSGINGAKTRFQKLDLDDKFFEDTIYSAGQRFSESSGAVSSSHREKLISILTNSSSSAIDFLTDLGVDLSVVTQLGGHSYARTHRGAGKKPPGVAIVSTLLDKLHKDFEPGRLQLLSDCEVAMLLTDEETIQEVTPNSPTSAVFTRVAGVQYRTGAVNTFSSIRGPVIFATGGFAGDTHGLLAQYRPDLAGLPSTNEPRPGMHRLLSDAGAQLVDMESVQIHPTGFVDPENPQARIKFLAAEILRGEGGIMLRQGRRFVNELDTRERVSSAITSEPPVGKEEEGELKQWDVELLLDPGAAEQAAEHVGFYTWKGLMQKKKVKDLDAVTRDTLQEYASFVRQGGDPLGRKAFGHWKLGLDGQWDEAEVVIGRVTPVTHFTMGGVAIDETARVLTKAMRPIPGLWAAGEITGGIHGDNRLGGSSLLECVVFGRIAGQHAAAALDAQ